MCFKPHTHIVVSFFFLVSNGTHDVSYHVHVHMRWKLHRCHCAQMALPASANEMGDGVYRFVFTLKFHCNSVVRRYADCIRCTYWNGSVRTASLAFRRIYGRSPHRCFAIRFHSVSLSPANRTAVYFFCE